MSLNESVGCDELGGKNDLVISTLNLRDGLELESVSALQPSLSSDIVVNDVQCNRRLDDHLSSIAETNIRWIAELHEAALKCKTNKRRLIVGKRLSPLGEKTALAFAGLLAGLTWQGAYDRLAKVRQPYMQWVTRALERLRPHVDPDVLIDEQQATPIARRLVVEMVCLLENKLILARLDNVRREHQRKRSVLLKRLVAFKRAFPKLMVLR